ncbi:MAG: class I SAM-dependent methyltransferase [Pseudomonadota bacterium]
MTKTVESINSVSRPVHRPNLTGVPETMLWPLWHRASEQKRSNPLINDPLALDLVDTIDYDFRGAFGPPNAAHVIRAALSDELVRKHIASSEGKPVVVSLGDGLETQPWRIDDQRVRWVSVDLPESIACRRDLLPAHPGIKHIAASALDPIWLKAVPRDSKPFISAAGLLMYFSESDVRRLLTTIADEFQQATVFFDTIPEILSRKTRKGLFVTPRYRAPAMPWGIAIDDVRDFIAQIPGLACERALTYGEAFPSRTPVLAKLSRVGFLRRRLAPGLVVAKCVPRSFDRSYR